MLVKGLQDDEHDQAEKLAAELDDIACNKDLAGLFSKLRPYYKHVFLSAAGTSVSMAKGKTTTMEETMVELANMFANMLSGKQITKEELVMYTFFMIRI